MGLTHSHPCPRTTQLRARDGCAGRRRRRRPPERRDEICSWFARVCGSIFSLFTQKHRQGGVQEDNRAFYVCRTARARRIMRGEAGESKERATAQQPPRGGAAEAKKQTLFLLFARGNRPGVFNGVRVCACLRDQTSSSLRRRAWRVRPVFSGKLGGWGAVRAPALLPPYFSPLTSCRRRPLARAPFSFFS